MNSVDTHIFAHLFNVWLNKRQPNSLSAFAFNLLQYLVLVETYEENLASHRYMVAKNEYLTAFSGNYGCFPLTSGQNSSGSLRGSCNEESKTFS